MQPTDSDVPSGSTRLRIAQALGLVALIAGLIGALGPAERVQTTYSWPPAELPAESPSRSWYTPLLLATHEPESISVDVPCNLPARLPGGDRNHVLSTARFPEQAGALSITQSRGELAIRLGGDLITSVALPTGGRAADCAHRVTIEGERWFVSGGTGFEDQGTVRRMPTVYGLFSSLDLRSGDALAVSVTTVPHETDPTLRQVLAWLVAGIAGLTALALVAAEGRRAGPRPRFVASLRRAVAGAHPADAVVALGLLAWCVIAPVNFDDGWVIQREQMYETSGGFSIYYQLLAVNMPLDYWLEWVHHWLAELSNTLLVYRVVIVALLMAVWMLCRWIAAQLRADSEAPIGTWALATVFLGGCFAWGITTRPEPVIALFLTGVTACAVAFLGRRSVTPIAVAAVLVPLALTAHPTGIVTLAPLIVAAPALLSWARSNLPAAVTVLSASTALLATLAFAGADLDTRLDDADVTQSLSGNSREELQRYAFLWEEPFGTPLRRAFVALLVLAIVAFVLRRRVGGRGSFPMYVLMVSLLLFVATPSKWPSHFGVLVGVGALAVAAEAAVLRRRGDEGGRLQPFPVLVICVATLVAVWAWWEREPWNPLDLRTLDWEPAFVTNVGLTQLAVLLPVLLFAVAALAAVARGRRNEIGGRSWRVASWSPAAILIPAIAFTVGVLVVDAAKTASWTVTRQNLGSLTGSADCGLAEDVVASSRASARPVSPTTRQSALPSWVPAAPVPDLDRVVLGPTTDARSYSPWFALPSGRTTGLFVAGTLGADDALRLEWGRRDGRTTSVLASEDVTDVVAEGSGNSPWRFFAAGDLAARDPQANAVRFEYRPASTPGSALAVTAPVTYENEQFASLMTREGARTLVYPELYLYFPCRVLPALRGGAVEVPQHIVIGSTDSPPLRYHVTSPFVGLLDLYYIHRIPVADSVDRVDRLRVFEVDSDIPGATLVEPTETTLTS